MYGEAINGDTMAGGAMLADAMDGDVVWAAGNETTGSASMDGALTSDVRRDDVGRGGVLRDCVDCRKCHETTPKEERQRENARARTPEGERQRTRTWLASRSGRERRYSTSCKRPSLPLYPSSINYFFYFIFLISNIHI